MTSQNIDASTDDPSGRKAAEEAWRKHRERLKPPILFYRGAGIHRGCGRLCHRVGHAA